MAKLGFSQLQFSGLTDKQYLSAREGGFTPLELEDKDYAWVNHHSQWIFPEDMSSVPMTAKQYAFLLGEVDFSEVDIESIHFSDARNVISKVLMMKKEDERYVHGVHGRFQNAKTRKSLHSM